LRLKGNVLVILGFFLFLVLLVKAAEDESEVINEDSKNIDLNNVDVDNNNIENSITNENIKKTTIENKESQGHHPQKASFGVYLRIVE
jgi:hypothetical protein